MSFVTAVAQSAQNFERIVAIVNDEPISKYDILQRTKLMSAMGALNVKAGKEDEVREKVLETLIEEHLKRQEARRLEVTASDEDLERELTRMVQSSGGSRENLTKILNQRGLKIDPLKKQIEAQMVWARIIRGRFGALLKITESEVDRRYQQAVSNPAPAQYTYVLRQVVLGIERDANRALVQARLAEAQLLMSRFKGCGSLRSAAKGIFDVKIGAAREVPVDGLPKEARQAFAKAGTGKLLPVGRRPNGFEFVAICNKNKIEAPLPSREQIKDRLVAEQLGMMSERYLRDLRRDSVVEYRR